MKKVLLLILLPAIMLSCSKDSDSDSDDGPGSQVDLSDADELTSVLVIPNAETVDGNMPDPTDSPEAPELVMVDETVSYCAGSQVKLPIGYINSPDIAGVYCQVQGAGAYFNITVSDTGNNGTIILPIGLPSGLENGNFCIDISLYDQDNNISDWFTTCITVTQPLSCGVDRSSGGEGITSTIHDMGNQSGTVIIEYDTYTVPDRIDVFYAGEWIAGTGYNPGPVGTVPPLADCDNPTEGYVGQAGMFCFPFNPATGGSEVEVVISGCVRGGTEWEYNISCAGDDGCQSITENLSLNGEFMNYPATVDAFVHFTGFTLGENYMFDNGGTRISLYTLIDMEDEAEPFHQGMIISGDMLRNTSNGGVWAVQIDNMSDINLNTQDYEEEDQGSIVITQYEEYESFDGTEIGLITLQFNNVKCSDYDEVGILSGTVTVMNYQ